MIVLYSTGCPRCKVLEQKLNDKGIEYTICDNTDVLERKNFMSVPILEIDEQILDFAQAIKWVNGVEKNNNI